MLSGFRELKKPDYSFLPDQDFDWTYSVYGDVPRDPFLMDMPRNHLVSPVTTHHKPWMLI